LAGNASKDRAVWEMSRTPGWQHVKKDVEEIRDSHLSRLRNCRPEDLQRLQGTIAGIEQVLNYVSALADRAVREPS